jgi:hypothetical protein
VGDLRLNFCFWLRWRVFRDRIEPAQFRTFFCFLLGFLDKDDDRLLLGDSVDQIGVSGDGISLSNGADSDGIGLLSLGPDPELLGRDQGENSPDDVSWPKKAHFLVDLGVDGADDVLAAAASISNGIEFRLFGPSGVCVVEWDKIGSAVRGRASFVRFGEGNPRFSFEGGEEVPAEMIEEILFDTE